MALKRHSRRATPGVTLVLLWLVGVNLRTVILGVPPTLPALHQALRLSYSAAGLLTSLPVFLMAAGAIPRAYLVSRVGARRARAGRPPPVAPRAPPPGALSPVPTPVALL